MQLAQPLTTLTQPLPAPTMGPRVGPLLGTSAGRNPTNLEPDEIAIARALRAGEDGAISRLYERYSQTVFAFLLTRIPDRAGAEDVLQQVFAELWRRGCEYNPERSGLFTWVMLIARSRATDALRRSHPEPHEPERAADLVDRLGGAEETEELIEQWRVADLLQRIPAAEADLLRMRFYEGLSQREISERTGIALGTVKMRMIQALGRIRSLIDEEGA